MAWNFAGRKSGTEHDPRLALSYAAKIEAVIGQPSFIQPQLFHWWNETECIPLTEYIPIFRVPEYSELSIRVGIRS
jgi:hypothetical protein